MRNFSHVAANALIVADWNQTLEISSNDKYYETNNILGKYPKKSEVNRYFISCLALYNGVYYILPDKYKTYYSSSIVGLQAYYVAHNYNLGIKVKF